MPSVCVVNCGVYLLVLLAARNNILFSFEYGILMSSHVRNDPFASFSRSTFFARRFVSRLMGRDHVRPPLIWVRRVRRRHVVNCDVAGVYPITHISITHMDENEKTKKNHSGLSEKQNSVHVDLMRTFRSDSKNAIFRLL